VNVSINDASIIKKVKIVDC